MMKTLACGTGDCSADRSYRCAGRQRRWHGEAESSHYGSFEANFSSNHLGPFLLTNRLLPLLRRAASDAPKGSVRILVTASDASEMIPGMDWNDLQGLANFNAGLANVDRLWQESEKLIATAGF
jgi:NAD(P)-dependent dehydrogenase (short-subunit alcohol dehydrogenase family)